MSYDDPIERSAAGRFVSPETCGAAEPGALRAELLDRDAIDDALRADWHALGEAVSTPNPYFAPWFLEPALRHLERERDVRLIALRRAKDGLLVALAPIVFQKGYSKLPLKHACVWTHRHCFNGAPLIRAGFEVAAFSALFEWIDTRPRGAKFIRFANLPFDHAMHGALAEACHLRGRDYRVQQFHERAILTSTNEFDAVMAAAMSGKKRKELRRQANRFAELGKAAFTDLPVENAALSTFLDLESAGWKATDPEGFPLAQSDAEAEFFCEAMSAGALAGAVTCTALTLDDAPKAMLFSLSMAGHTSLFKTAYDEDMSAWSPGVRLLIETTRRMLDSDTELLDSCAKQGHPVVDGLWSERLPIAQINVPANRPADKGLLRTAATLESIKNRALKRLTPRKD